MTSLPPVLTSSAAASDCWEGATDWVFSALPRTTAPRSTLAQSQLLWGASVRKVAPGKAAEERKLQAHLPLVIPFVFWFFQHCPPRCTMPAGEDRSWWPSCDTPGDMPALVSIADSLDCPFTALPLAAFLNVLHWLLFLPFSQVIYHKCYTFTCSEFHDWLLYYKSHPVVSCCHF